MFIPPAISIDAFDPKSVGVMSRDLRRRLNSAASVMSFSGYFQLTSKHI
jgi:hypothetical protein